MGGFQDALEFVLEQEGGKVNHPADPGRLTTYGISKRSFPDLDIPNLTLEQASRIYKNLYWERIRGAELPLNIAVILFDWAVNSGVRLAVRRLQRLLKIKADGWVGPVTIRAAQAHPGGLAQLLIADRMNFYTDQSTFDVFGRGWIRRSASLLKFITALDAAAAEPEIDEEEDPFP